MNKRWIFFGLAFLIVVLTTWSALAYEVNRPLDIQVKLQYDNGMTLTDVVSQACIISIYNQGTSSLVVRDANMTAGSYHDYSFTPTSTGDYVLSVKCDHNNESASYHETITIMPQTTSGGSGGQVLNLNAKIVPDKSSYVVNLGVDSKLSFGVAYYVDGKAKNSNVAQFRVLKGDQVVKTGGFVIKDTGSYVFDEDFKDYVTGDYQIALYFDGRTEFVALKVISVAEDLSPITGFVTNSDGKVSVVKLGLLIFFALFIILLTVVFIRSLRKGGRKQS